MKLPADLSPGDPIRARIIAQVFVHRGFNLADAVLELRPDITKCKRNVLCRYGAALLREPLVQHEIEVIMNRTENNAKKFVKLMWEWLEAPADDDKAAQERKVSAARILAKGYINEKGQPPEPKPLNVDGMDKGLAALVGDSEGIVQ